MLSSLDTIYAATCIMLFVIIHSIAVINSSSLIIPSAHHPAVLLIQGCTSEIELSVPSGNDTLIIPSFTIYSSPEIKLSLSILSSDHHFALLFTQTGITWSSVTSSRNVSTIGSSDCSDAVS